jgi:hypothetical protein
MSGPSGWTPIMRHVNVYSAKVFFFLRHILISVVGTGLRSCCQSLISGSPCGAQQATDWVGGLARPDVRRLDSPGRSGLSLVSSVGKGHAVA